jgi:hypothetical protein
VSKSREQINQFLSKIDITDKVVLDVGVQNNPARKYTKGKPEKYLTLDIDEEWKPDIVADFNEKITYYPNNFDVVFCLEVLEHCWNPIIAVKNLANLTDGVCYISVPFINPLHDKWDYLRYTPEWFEKVLPMVGFKKVIVKKRMATIGMLELMKFYRQEGLRMSKIRLKAGQSKDQALIGLFIEAWK